MVSTMLTAGLQWAADTAGVHQSSPTRRRSNEVAARDRRTGRRWLMSVMETATRAETQTQTQTQTQTSLLLTLPEVAAQRWCARRSVERQIAQRHLHVVRIGRAVRVERTEWSGSCSTCAPKAMVGRRRVLASTSSPAKDA